MSLDYSSLPQCVARASERSGVTDEDAITDVLVVTAGKLGSKVVYRVYWAAAMLLDQRLRQIKSAEGVTFRDVEAQVKSLKELQWITDAQLGIIGPKGTNRSDRGVSSQSTVNSRSRIVFRG